MPKVLKRNAVAVFIFATVFYVSFMFAKHDPALRDVIPFGEDPYDAVGSFGVIVAILIALLSLVRAFRPLRETPSAAQRLYLIRSQQAVVLTVFITLAADFVAMARHPSMWMGTASQDRLIELLGGVMMVTIILQLLVRASQPALPEPGSKPWIGAATTTLIFLFVLAAYPEQLIDRLPTHLLTVVAGPIVLFAPMRPLLIALVPNPVGEAWIEKRPARGQFSAAGRRWTLVVVVGILIGTFVFLGEVAEGSSAPSIDHLVLVGSVFIGLGLAGILIAYAFLAKPLGLGPHA